MAVKKEDLRDTLVIKDTLFLIEQKVAEFRVIK